MPKSNWPTTSRQSRGYGAEWQVKRKVVLERDGHLCQCTYCKREGRVAIATEVDHVISRANALAAGWTTERTESVGNLQSINATCHLRKTVEEQGKRFRPIIGLDGFAIQDTRQRGGGLPHPKIDSQPEPSV